MNRILVTGSRTWGVLRLPDGSVVRSKRQWEVIETVLTEYSKLPDVVLVHGGASRGADYIADTIWKKLGLPVEVHPANWSKYGKRAGILRNQEMVDLGATVCLAFIKNHSPGSSHCLSAARAAGIPCRVWRIDPVSDLKYLAGELAEG